MVGEDGGKIKERHGCSCISLPRQQVAFLKECRKINGCGSLKRNFYTRFIPNFSGFGAVTWRKMNSISVVRWLLLECYFSNN